MHTCYMHVTIMHAYNYYLHVICVLLFYNNMHVTVMLISCCIHVTCMAHPV